MWNTNVPAILVYNFWKHGNIKISGWAEIQYTLTLKSIAVSISLLGFGQTIVGKGEVAGNSFSTILFNPFPNKP